MKRILIEFDEDLRISTEGLDNEAVEALGLLRLAEMQIMKFVWDVTDTLDVKVQA